MIQLVVNVNLLREINERSLIYRYAKHCYEGENSTSDDDLIKQNLQRLLDWDIRGELGLAIYCSKFESIKRKDWKRLIQFIKENHHEIRTLGLVFMKRKRVADAKVIRDEKTKIETRKRETFSAENYKPDKRGLPAKPCTYEGRTYQSRLECQYKEGLTQSQLYRYLEKTGQV